MHRSLRMLPLAALLLAGACKGDMGPTGPSGPAGPQGPSGPAGPGTRVSLTATTNSAGSAAVAVPAAATANNTLPVTSCYLNQPGTSSFLLIGTDINSASCGLVRATNGTYSAVIISAPANWNAVFVFVY